MYFAAKTSQNLSVFCNFWQLFWKINNRKSKIVVYSLFWPSLFTALEHLVCSTSSESWRGRLGRHVVLFLIFTPFCSHRFRYSDHFEVFCMDVERVQPFVFWIVGVRLPGSGYPSLSPRATLTLLSCSPNFPRASITRYTHANHEPILKSTITEHKTCLI